MQGIDHGGGERWLDVSSMQDFRKLRVWQEAQRFSIVIKRHTLSFPRGDYGGLRGQMGRAAESIPDNIAEGAGAATNADFARYLDNAIKSSCELEAQIDRSHGFGLTRDRDRDRFIAAVCDIRKMLWGLRKKVRGRL